MGSTGSSHFSSPSSDAVLHLQVSSTSSIISSGIFALLRVLRFSVTVEDLSWRRGVLKRFWTGSKSAPLLLLAVSSSEGKIRFLNFSSLVQGPCSVLLVLALLLSS